MDILAALAGLLAGAALTWQFAQGRAAADRDRRQAAADAQILRWREAAERAAATAAREQEQALAWRDGCAQGRADILAVARALGYPPAAPAAASNSASNSAATSAGARIRQASVTSSASLPASIASSRSMTTAQPS
jgi:hypothetical protein